MLALLVAMILDGVRCEIGDDNPTSPFQARVADDGGTTDPAWIDSGLGLVMQAVRAAQTDESDRVRELSGRLLDLPDETERSHGIAWILSVAADLGDRASARDGRLPRLSG